MLIFPLQNVLAVSPSDQSCEPWCSVRCSELNGDLQAECGGCTSTHECWPGSDEFPGAATGGFPRVKPSTCGSKTVCFSEIVTADDLRAPEKAQHTHVRRLPGFLNEGNVTTVVSSLAVWRGQREVVTDADSERLTKETWALRRDASDGDFGALLRRVEELAWEIDASEGWGLLPAGRQLGRGIQLFRCDNHVYHPGGGVFNPKHHDSGSLVTVVLMLSPSRDYVGGSFQTLEVGGTLRQWPFDRGDALVFCANKYHSVGPLLSGRREVLIFEFADDSLSTEQILGSLAWSEAAGADFRNLAIPSATAMVTFNKGDATTLTEGCLWVVLAGTGCVLSSHAPPQGQAAASNRKSFGEPGLLRELLQWLLEQSTVHRLRALELSAATRDAESRLCLTHVTDEHVIMAAIPYTPVIVWLTSLGEAAVFRVAEELTRTLSSHRKLLV